MIMEKTIDLYLNDAQKHMGKAVTHTRSELAKIRAGKARAAMLDGLKVSYYGVPTVIDQVATISTPDAMTIAIKPWERNIIPDIEKAIKESNLGLNPQNDGELIRLNIPSLTRERRSKLAKQAKEESEYGKISVRNIRKDTKDQLRKLQKLGASEDAIKLAEENVQQMTNSYIQKIDKILVQKEKDIMTL